MKNFILQNLASEGPQKPQGRTCLIYQSKKEREEEGKTLSIGDCFCFATVTYNHLKQYCYVLCKQ